MKLYRSKFEEVAQSLATGVKSVLDIGCRDGKLKKFLPEGIEYAGIDLSPGPHVTKVCNAESGIPSTMRLMRSLHWTCSNTPTTSGSFLASS